jgi:hypothetical protein
LNYILEYDEVRFDYVQFKIIIFVYLQGKGREFIEIYRGTKKQFMVNKLIPATFYAFRLAAENSIGRR